LFSPTYEPVVRRMRFASSSTPRPQPSTPQLFETVDEIGRALLEQRLDQVMRECR
jgi:hypothetical protein